MDNDTRFVSLVYGVHRQESHTSNYVCRNSHNATRSCDIQYQHPYTPTHIYIRVQIYIPIHECTPIRAIIYFIFVFLPTFED